MASAEFSFIFCPLSSSNDIALQRLDNLTQEEGWMAAAEGYAPRRRVIDGTQALFDYRQSQFQSRT